MATYVDLSTLHTPLPRSKPPATWGAQIRENDEWFQANRRQICTSSTRPTGFEGLEIYETDTDRTYIHNGADWVQTNGVGAARTYTPTWTQSATITKTVTRSEYHKDGRFVWGVVNLSATSAGTATNAIAVSTPVTAAWGSAQAVGSGYFYNGSVNLPLIVLLNTTSAFQFITAFSAQAGFFGVANVFYTSAAGANTSYTPTVASGNGIVFHYAFETTN